MKYVKIRKIIVNIHRCLGLLVGLILIVVGLTGSLLVFENELNTWDAHQRFGQVVRQAQPLSDQSLVNIVKKAYANHPDWQVTDLRMRPHQDFYTVRLNRPDETQWEVFLNPYTGKVMGDRQLETTLFNRLLHLHYELLAGNIGLQVVGIAALCLCILSLTGIILWPGWRKFLLGFKIKWDAHPKRVNYDIHKVAGIVAAVFLGATAFTGFCWNFYDQSVPLIYAVTLTPKPPEVQSTMIAGKSPLEIDDIVRRSDLALPGGVNTSIQPPTKPEGTFTIYKKLPEDVEDFDNYVMLDQYSGKVLQVKDSRVAGLGDRILNSFTPLHYGTFGGLPSRILYVFVGLAPLVLLITGAKMFKIRIWDRAKRKEVKDLAAIQNSEN